MASAQLAADAITGGLESVKQESQKSSKRILCFIIYVYFDILNISVFNDKDFW